METFIIIASVLLLFHFIYETTILPSIQNVLRFKVYAIRNKLINIVVNDKKQISPSDFNFLMHHISISYQHIDKITFSLLIGSYFEDRHSYEIPEDTVIVNTDNISFFQGKEYEEKCMKYMFFGFVANSFMLLLYLSPLIFIIIMFSWVFGTTKKLHDKLVNALTISADQKFDTKPLKNNTFCYDGLS